MHSPASPSSWTARSEDGRISYALSTDELGVFLERGACRNGQGQIVQFILFRDRNAFTRWAADEPARFTHPLLFSELSRHFHEQFESFAACGR